MRWRAGPIWRIAPADAIPIGQKKKRSNRSLPAISPCGPKALALAAGSGQRAQLVVAPEAVAHKALGPRFESDTFDVVSG